MANKYQMCSTPLAIKVFNLMKIKYFEIFVLPQLELAKIEKTTDIKCCKEYGELETLNDS